MLLGFWEGGCGSEGAGGAGSDVKLQKNICLDFHI